MLLFRGKKKDLFVHSILDSILAFSEMFGNNNRKYIEKVIRFHAFHTVNFVEPFN